MNDILAEEYGVSAPLLKKAAETEEKCAEVFKQIDKVKEYNQLRVLHAFMEDTFFCSARTVWQRVARCFRRRPSIPLAFPASARAMQACTVCASQPASCRF